MTPKQKANELLEKFKIYSKDYIDNRQCALIAVEEIISLNIKYHGREIENNLWNIEYWKEVEQEIEKL